MITINVTQAIQQMKAGKAPGSDNICPEMLKTYIHFAGRVFTDLFRNIWTNDAIPNDWNKGLIVKLPKKGDFQHCDNWRGITLLSVTSNIFQRKNLFNKNTTKKHNVRKTSKNIYT